MSLTLKLFYVVLMVGGYGLVGNLDYQDARAQECAAHRPSQDYDKETDQCHAPATR